MATLGEVKQRVRSLCEDEDGDYLTDEYLIPKINQVYETVVLFLEDSGANPFAEEVRDLPGIKAGTRDFIAATADGKPWEGLENPIKLEVKSAGDDESTYRKVANVQELPNVAPISNAGGFIFGSSLGCGAVEWRGNQLYITPFDFDADFRLRAEFRPAKLVNDSDIIMVHAFMTAHLSWGTAALVVKPREMKQDYSAQAEETLNKIANKLTKQTQGETIKFGKARRRRATW